MPTLNGRMHRLRKPFETWRTSAYQCRTDDTGKLISRGNYVAGWYGKCTEEKLLLEIIPKLNRCSEQGQHYPFLITMHQLGEEAEFSMYAVHGRKARIKDFQFRPRQKSSPPQQMVIVYSPKKYRYF